MPPGGTGCLLCVRLLLALALSLLDLTLLRLLGLSLLLLLVRRRLGLLLLVLLLLHRRRSGLLLLLLLEARHALREGGKLLRHDLRERLPAKGRRHVRGRRAVPGEVAARVTNGAAAEPAVREVGAAELAAGEGAARRHVQARECRVELGGHAARANVEAARHAVARESGQRVLLLLLLRLCLSLRQVLGVLLLLLLLRRPVQHLLLALLRTCGGDR